MVMFWLHAAHTEQFESIKRREVELLSPTLKMSKNYSSCFIHDPSYSNNPFRPGIKYQSLRLLTIY